jgi:hypothetical protein
MATEKLTAKTETNVDLRNTHTFKIDKRMPYGATYEGTFTIHRPTVGEKMKIGVLEAMELGGMNNIDNLVSGLAHIVATLDVIIDDHPIWWEPRKLRDVEVIQAVWEEYINYLNEFQKQPEHKTGSGEAS